MLTEIEYLDVVERVQRWSMGDQTISKNRIVLDIAHLIADWREWEQFVAGELPVIRARLTALEDRQRPKS